jgi:hypothetical protein
LHSPSIQPITFIKHCAPKAAPTPELKALSSVRKLDLPTEPDRLATLAPHTNAKLDAALIRAPLHDDLRKKVTG